jgi:hypothetical protein
MEDKNHMGRFRRLMCGFFGGVLLRLSINMPTWPSKIVCIVWGVFLIIFGAVSDAKLAKILAEHRKEWWERYVDEEERWR